MAVTGFFKDSCSGLDFDGFISLEVLITSFLSDTYFLLLFLYGLYSFIISMVLFCSYIGLDWDFSFLYLDLRVYTVLGFSAKWKDCP